PTTVGDDVTIGHLAHLEGCIVEDKALIGSGSIVLHNARIGVEAVVGGGAFVRNNTIVPPLAMALGVPAVIKEDAVRPGHFDLGVESYVKRATRYRDQLRRID
ncbi:MAG: gamma carbonic anhydrase family protein, partial [Microthrixaceae bacterium]